ncbi:hypothetical protein SK128_018773 [Halocaridina rubra]|uniref:Uncharacterized protein n=1 Tax=Halocaridina rubra TaxID=373956 RepID=A0AAN9AFG1_HALRR
MRVSRVVRSSAPHKKIFSRTNHTLSQMYKMPLVAKKTIESSPDTIMEDPVSTVLASAPENSVGGVITSVTTDSNVGEPLLRNVEMSEMKKEMQEQKLNLEADKSSATKTVSLDSLLELLRAVGTFGSIDDVVRMMKENSNAQVSSKDQSNLDLTNSLQEKKMNHIIPQSDMPLQKLQVPNALQTNTLLSREFSVGKITPVVTTNIGMWPLTLLPSVSTTQSLVSGPKVARVAPIAPTTVVSSPGPARTVRMCVTEAPNISLESPKKKSCGDFTEMDYELIERTTSDSVVSSIVAAPVVAQSSVLNYSTEAQEINGNVLGNNQNDDQNPAATVCVTEHAFIQPSGRETSGTVVTLPSSIGSSMNAPQQQQHLFQNITQSVLQTMNQASQQVNQPLNVNMNHSPEMNPPLTVSLGHTMQGSEPLNGSLNHTSQKVNQSLTASQGVNQAIAVPQGVNQSLTVSQGVNQAISASQSLNQPLTVSQGVNQAISVPQSMNQPLTVSQGVNQSISVPQSVNQPLNISLNHISHGVSQQTHNLVSQALPQPLPSQELNRPVTVSLDHSSSGVNQSMNVSINSPALAVSQPIAVSLNQNLQVGSHPMNVSCLTSASEVNVRQLDQQSISEHSSSHNLSVSPPASATVSDTMFTPSTNIGTCHMVVAPHSTISRSNCNQAPALTSQPCASSSAVTHSDPLLSQSMTSIQMDQSGPSSTQRTHSSEDRPRNEGMMTPASTNTQVSMQNEVTSAINLSETELLNYFDPNCFDNV